jgi:replicative DNA helicase
LLNLALNASTDVNNPTAVGVFSLEMGKNQLVQRLMCNYCDLPLERIKSGNLVQTEFDTLATKSGQLSQKPIYIDDTPGLNIIEFRAKARRMVSRHNVGLIIIDYLQLMNGSGKYSSREQEVAQMSKSLKHIAKQLDIPIIALSQLNRAVEARADMQPKLSDLRESGAIEQDADVICFLYGHPKDYIEKNPYAKDDKMFDIAKHRNGKLANFIYKFDGDKQRFHSEDLQMFDVQENKQQPEITKFTPPTNYAPNLKPLTNNDLPF